MPNKIKLETMTLMHKIQTNINLNKSGLRRSKRIPEQKRKGRSNQAQSTCHIKLTVPTTFPSVMKFPHTDKVKARPTHKVT